MATDTKSTTAAPEGFDGITTSRDDRLIVRLALKRFANDLTRQQRSNTQMGAPNPIIIRRLEAINGTPGGNLPGLVRRFMLDGDSDPAEPKADKGKKKDPAQMDLTVGNGGAKGDRSIARGKKLTDDGAAAIKAAARSGA